VTNLKTTALKMSNRQPEIGAQELTALPRAGRMAQAILARMLNVSTEAVQSWEQGHRR
jgi:DNA-binding transcriptional regulator YiaG